MIEKWRGRELALDSAVIIVVKVIAGIWALRAGFQQISDDDYARTVIAQEFAHAPKLDPSGTSWLPFSFWIAGTLMMIVGRSLSSARAIAFVLGAASVCIPYLAMRRAGVARISAIAGAAIAMLTPLNVFLGIATVPEAWTFALMAAALIAVEHAPIPSAVCALTASLSRYEAWPVCGVVFACLLYRAWKTRRRDLWMAAALAAAGPALWMLWNLHAHGDALHFFARVSAYKQAHAGASRPLSARLSMYPASFSRAAPEIVILLIAGAVAARKSDVGDRWRIPLLGAAAVLGFLIYGELKDGAPTHHPERSMMGLAWIFGGYGADALILSIQKIARERLRQLASLVPVVAWCIAIPIKWSYPPAHGDSERRDAQITRGLDLRARGVQHIEVIPCAYEHFALIAAFSEPDRATIHQSTNASVTAACPFVAER